MNKESCMIHSTRFHPTTPSDLIKIKADDGILGVYNRGQSDMYDYLMDKLNKLYINHIAADYESPNSYVLMDFFNQFKDFIKKENGHILEEEEELDKIMEE